MGLSGFQVISNTGGLSANDDSPQVALGSLMQDNAGNIYRYVKAVDLDLAAGDVVEYASTSQFDVTKDRAGGSSIGRKVAGVAQSAISVNNYGWILVSGISSAVTTDGGVTAADFLVPHATADGQADTMAAGLEHQAFGFALATDVGSTTQAVVNCL